MKEEWINNFVSYLFTSHWKNYLKCPTAQFSFSHDFLSIRCGRHKAESFEKNMTSKIFVSVFLQTCFVQPLKEWIYFLRDHLYTLYNCHMPSVMRIPEVITMTIFFIISGSELSNLEFLKISEKKQCQTTLKITWRSRVYWFNAMRVLYRVHLHFVKEDSALFADLIK